MSNETKCFYCDGHGEVAPHILDDQPCPVCNGTGKKPIPVSVETSKPADLLDFKVNWDKVWDLLEPWQKVWEGDRKSFEAEFPAWILDAAGELFAHDLCDVWAWNEYVKAASVIIKRHAAAHISEVERLTKERDALTYKSSQHTNCAVCGEDKHTPLRLDEPDGYVCLTCTLKLLEETQSDRDEYEKQLEAAESKLSQLQLELRQRLWMGHGHTLLYGDDGEMQCNECRLSDYKRGDIDELRQQAVVMRIKTLESQKLANEEKAKMIAFHVETWRTGGAPNGDNQFVENQILAILNGGQS